MEVSRGIGELIDRHSMDARDLSGIGRVHRGRLLPPGEYGSHDEVAHRDPEIGEKRKGHHSCGVERRLLLGFAQGSLDRPDVTGLERAAGEGRLTRVRTHVVCALDEQDVGTFIPFA